MKRLLLLLAVAALITLPASADAQKRCVKGKPCGNTCIAANKTCRIGSTPSRPLLTRLQLSDTLQWVASSQGQVYYRRGCSTANALSPKNRIYFRTEKEAQKAGYKRSKSRGC